MTDLTPDDTRDRPGPLDAFETLKPGKKHFTLQAGDPLAPPLILAWAYLARVRAGLLTANIEHLSGKLAYALPTAQSEAQSTELMLRATNAESIAWDMQAYQRGHTALSETEAQRQGYEQTSMIGSGSADALEKLLRHRRLQACEEKLGNIDALRARGKGRAS